MGPPALEDFDRIGRLVHKKPNVFLVVGRAPETLTRMFGDHRAISRRLIVTVNISRTQCEQVRRSLIPRLRI